MVSTEENFSILKDTQDGEVALKGVSVRARLHELIAEVEVEQTYVNPQKSNIETIYTFPLPIGALLLGLELEIAGKKLSGLVIERKKAERDYEDAVTDGNSAVILQEVGPGLYTASIGNLMAKETAVIRYRYALMLSWQGPKLRFLIPTTIAPRYGYADAAGMESHQIPKSSLTVQYPLSLTVVVEGGLASATIASPTHPIAFERLPVGIAAKLAGQAVLDRDFVLTLESELEQSCCIHTPDGGGHVAVASIRIPPVNVKEGKPLAVKLLIDCSGSMGGTSIIQARKAALEILNALSQADSFNVTLFGSEFKHLFPGMVPATGKFITEAWIRLAHLEADMGGTEMEKALAATFAIGGSETPPSVLLITDGEIQEHEKLVSRAATAAHRVFTVGVGTAVVDVFLESLARTTGGACELVSPQEGMAEKILSQFHRLRQTKLEHVQLDWPTMPDWTTQLPKTMFAGDTVHVFAGFKHAPNGAVSLRTAVAGQPLTVSTSLASSDEKELPRIAAAHRIKGVPQQQALTLSLKYQLLSKWTSYLVVAERDVKANDLPRLHQIPQMLAAGWGGTGLVLDAPPTRASASVARASISRPSPSPIRHYSLARPSSEFDDTDNDIPFGDDSTPKISTLPAARPIQRRFWKISPKQFVEQLEASVFLHTSQPKLPVTLAELDGLGLEKTISNQIRELITSGYQEIGLISALLHALAESGISHLFERNLKRIIMKRWKEVSPGALFNQEMSKAVSEVTVDVWGTAITDDQPF